MFNDYNEYIERCIYQLYTYLSLGSFLNEEREREKGNYYNWKVIDIKK